MSESRDWGRDVDEAAPLAYAGFWRRVLAAIIDGILLGIVSDLVASAMGVTDILREVFERIQGIHDPQLLLAEIQRLMAAAGPELRNFQLVMLIVNWTYFALLESSPWQATLGKLAVGAFVTDLDGRRIGFLRATGRYFGKILSALIFLIGYLMVAFTARKQGLHDMLAGTLVVRRAAPPPPRMRR